MNESVVRSAKLFQDEEQRLQGAQRWADLVSLYAARADAVDDDGLRERMLYRAGEVSLDHLSRAEQAEGFFLRAFEVRRTYLPALGALKAMHLDRKDRAGARRVLALEVGVTKDARRLGQLHHELGRLLREEGKPQEALAALLQAIEANPKSRLPLDDLEQLAKKHQRWDALVQAYRALAGAAQDKQAAIYHFLAGTILDESAKDPEEATRAFAAALDAGPKDARILGTITRFFERRGEWALAARGLFQHLEVAQDDPKERVRLLKRLATIHDTSLNAPQQAVKHLQRALELEPKDALAVKQLMGLGEKLKDPRVVAHALELEAELPGLKDAERAERWERAAEQRDRAREGRAALRAVKRAVELRPRHVGALKLMETITRKLGDWPEHARALELERELIVDPRRSEQERRVAVALGKRLAEVFELRLKDDARAAEALAQVVALDPKDGQALERLELIARRAGDWAEVARVLERRVAGAARGDNNQKVWLRELALVRRDQLKDGPAAARALEQLLALGPADPTPALRDLAPLLRAEERWQPLADALSRLAELERDPAARAAALRQLGAVRLERLDQAPAAVEALDAALALVPDGDGALEAVRLRVDAARALGDDAGLAKALATWTRLEPEPTAQRRIRFELAGLEERRGNAAGALAAYEEVLAEEPADAGALEGAVRLLLDADRAADAAQRLDAALVAVEGDRPRTGALAADLARLCEARLQDPARARAAWHRALRAVPDHREAFERLAALAAEAGLPAQRELLHAVEQVAAEAADPALRADMWRHQATLAEGPLALPPAAVAALERVLAQDPTDAAALQGLRRLYRRTQRWGDLARLLEEAAALPAPPAPDLDPAGCRRELAAVCDEELDDLPRAGRALEALTAGLRDPDDPAWEQLAGVERRLGRHDELVRVLRQAAALGGPPAVRVKRLVEAAEVQERDLGAPVEAAVTLDEALAVLPRSRDLLTRLGRVLVRADALPRAFGVLGDAAEAAAAEGDAAGAAALQVERGQVQEQAGDPTSAEDAYRAAIAASPTHAPGHEALLALLSRLGRLDRLEVALAAAAEALPQGERAALLVRRGEMLARLGRLDDALAAFDQAEAARPRWARCREARVRALRPANRPGPLADALAARRGAEPAELDRPERLAVLREEAELRGLQLGDLPAARALLLEALGAGAPSAWGPDEREALRCLLRIERRMSLGAPLADHLEAAGGLEQDGARRADLLVEAGRVRRQREDDALRARQLFERALEADPARLEAVRWLATLAREANDRAALARWTAREAELEPDPKRKAALLVRLAAGQRKDKGGGRATYEQALKHDPDSVEALRGLAPLLRGQRAWAELAAALARLGELEADRRQRVERLVALGEVRLEHLKQPPAAREAFDAALALAPADLRALRGRARTLDPKTDAAALVETLARQLEATPAADHRVALGKHLAALRQERLGDPAGAVAALEEVLRLAPDDEDAWRRLRDLHLEARDWAALAGAYECQARRSAEPARREERLRQAALIVHHHLRDAARAADLYQEVLALGDPQCVALGELPKLLLELKREQAYEALLLRVREVVPRTRSAARSLIELARRKAARGEGEAAAQHFEAALEEDPDALEALDGLAALHEAARDWPRLAAALDRKRRAVTDEAQAVELRLQRAKLLEEELRDLPAAADELRAAAQAAPRRADVLERLTSLCRRCEWWQELAPALGALADLTKDPHKAARLLDERARVEREQLRLPRQAIDSYRAALRRKPSPELLDPLLELYEQEELWDELVPALEERAAFARAKGEKAALLQRAARALDERLRRPDDAIQAWGRALDAAPDPAAFEALQALCARVKDDRRLADALAREVDHLAQEEGAQAGERLVARALAGAERYAALDLRPRAEALLEAALARDPRCRPAFEALERLLVQAGEPARLYDLLRRFAAHAPSADERAALHERMARLAEDELKSAQEARGHWEQVLALRPGDPAATEGLRRLYAAAHAWEELARVLRAEAAAMAARHAASGEADARALAALYVELGEVLERHLGRGAEAATAYAEAAARAPDDPRPLVGLERVHQAAGAWTDLVRVRQRLRDQEVDPRKRAQWALKVADAHERLGRRDEAIQALREALEEVPDNASVLALLRRYLLEAERWAEAADLLAREADVARERAAQLARRLERAAVLRDRLGDAAAATEELERARALAPQDKAALGQLAQLYEAAGAAAKLADVLQSLAVVEEDDRAASDLYERAGALLEEADPEAAARAHERAARRDPLRAGPLDALERIYARREAWQELARTLHRRAGLARALSEEAPAFLRRAAQVEEQRLGQQALAAATLELLLQQAPRDPETLAELARLRGALGEHAAHQEVLGRLAEVTADDGERARLLLEQARILETKLRRPAAAAVCVRAALELVERTKPDEARVLAGLLMRLAKAAGDASALLDATERALKHARDPGDEALLLKGVGELASGPVYTPGRAIEVYAELHRRDPQDGLVRQALEGLYLREARHRELLGYLEGEARRLGKEGAAAEVQRLRHRMAELHRGSLGDPAAAEGCWLEALEADAGDDAARAGLEALYRAGRRLPELARLLAERAARATTELEAVQALAEEAAVHEEQGAPDAATARLEAARERAGRAGVPGELLVRVLRALVRLYRQAGRHADLAQALSALAGREDLGALDRAAAETELGHLLQRELRQEEEAARAFERALALDPQSVPAARALAAIHRQAGRLAEVVRVCELEATAKVDRGRLVWLKTHVGQLRHELRDLEGAAKAYGEALHLDAVSLVALRGMADVARELLDFRALAQALEALAEHTPSPVDRLEARRELAHLYEEALSDLRRAVACFRKVLADAPDDLEAVRGLARGLRALGDDEGLAETLEQELGLVTEAERRRLLALEAARLREALAEKAAGDARQASLQRALGLARTACELMPSDADALGTYARVAEKLSQWGELADATVLLARAVDDPARAGWMLRRAAKIRALRLADAPGAIAAYREAAATNPADQEAWEALEPLCAEVEDDALLLVVLERLLALARKDAQRAQAALKLGRHQMKLGRLSEAIDAFVTARELGRGPLLAQALEALEAAYRLAGRHAELAHVLEQRAADGRAPHARDLLLERAALLEEKLGRHDQAIEVLQRLHQLVPDDARVASELERLLSGQARWAELVTFYEGQAGRRGPRAYDALVLLGRVLRDRLDDAEKAARALQRAVTLNPAGLEAVEALRDLYQKTERWPELLDTLRLEIGLVKGTRQREARLRRAGHLAEEKLGDLLTAARFFGEASHLAPKDRNLLGDLARVQEARGDWSGLVDTLRRDLPLCGDAGEAVRLHKRLGAVFSSKLYRKQDALAAYRAALELAPQDEEALAALTDLLRDLGEWDELAQIIDRRLARARGPETVGLRLELARVNAERLGRPEEALKAAEEALGQDARCIEAALLAVTVLRRTARDAKGEAALVRALKRLAGLREGTERADALVEVVEVLRRRPGKGKEAQALEALAEAFKADPAHEAALAQLGAAQEAAGLWDDLLGTYEQAVAHARTEFKRGDLLARIAGLLERRGDVAGAEARYREAIGLAPTHLPALKGLARALHARGAGALGADESAADALARLEDQVADLEQDPRDAAQALVRAGDVRREALGQFPAARQRYEQALQRSPTLFPALAALAELAWAADDAAAALSCLERVASSPELPKDPQRGAELLWARGQLLERAGRAEGAAQSYRQALELVPDHLAALEDLGRLCVQGGGWAAARGVYEELVAQTRPPVARAEHQLVLARVLSKLKETDRALELYRSGLRVAPRSPQAQLELGKLLESKDPREARRHLEYALAGAPPQVEVQARLALADVCELALGDADAAAAHLQATLAIDGEHRARTARRLAEIHGRAERWSAAVRQLTRAIELETDRRKRAELYANLARVVRDRLKQRKLARRCFHQAFVLDPRERHTLDSLLRLLEAEGDLEAQARALGVAADALRGKGDEAALRLRRADLLAQQRLAPEAAAEYERVLELEPGHSGARAALSRLYLELKDVAGIERVQRELLAEDPLLVESYRALADGWRAGGRADPLGQALQALSVLRATTAEEEGAVAAAAGQLPSLRGRLKDEAFAARLLPDACKGPLGDLVRAAGGLLLRQVPDDLKSHGIGWLSARLTLEGDLFPEHRLVKRVCDLLDISQLDIYWMPDWRRPEPVLGHSKTPSLILCPEVFAGLSEPEKAFVIARAVAPLKLGLEVFRALPLEQVRGLLLGLLKACEAGRAFKGDDDKAVRAMVKAAGKASEVLRELAPVHEALWRGRDQLDLEGFRQGVLLAASRAGLLAAGGPLPAVKAILATNVSLRGRVPTKTEGVVKAFRDVPELRDLLAFSVSPGYLELRKKLARG
ncbi:MAG: hypothetical protein M9894_08630 [Planctomycetes bacterium]|nr:hypothetical protein [Planctomycetota bacterium]